MLYEVITATAIDLAGRDVFEAVQMSVNPKVINTPPVTAVSKDGIQLIAKARVTVRANIKQLVGGAGEETVLARVGEGIVSSIGSSHSHKAVLENPDFISRVITSYSIHYTKLYEGERSSPFEGGGPVSRTGEGHGPSRWSKLSRHWSLSLKPVRTKRTPW